MVERDLEQFADLLADLVAERLVEPVAERVADLLADRIAARPPAHPVDGLVDTREIARRFGISRDSVYAQAERFGAIRIGDGPRARLRFDPDRVAEELRGSRAAPAPVAAPAPAPRRRRAATTPSGVPLLPIRSEEA